MNPYFRTITEANKLALNKPVDADVVYYSELNEWFTSDAFRSFSLKFVVDKSIYYKVGNREHHVKGGHFLLASKQPHVKAYFDSKEKVKSVCIDICPATVAEAFTVMTRNSDGQLDNYLAGYFDYPHFFESISPVEQSALNVHLKSMLHAIQQGYADQYLDRGWFFSLVEKIVQQEYGHYKALNSIESVKLSTRKELLVRLQTAKKYMDECFVEIEDVNEVARAAHLSEFHFYRSFRQAYNVTPYQYLLHKRLEHAKVLIMEGQNTLTEIACHCNFPDIYTFSKAFKKLFDVAPSKYKNESEDLRGSSRGC